MNELPITSLYAMPLGLIFLTLWVNVTRTRASLNISIGDGGNIVLHERIRRHGNFVEWVPMVMILMILAEAQNAGAIYLHITGVLLVLGRLVHPFGLMADKASNPLRIIGNTANLIATVNVLICLVMTTIY